MSSVPKKKKKKRTPMQNKAKKFSEKLRKKATPSELRFKVKLNYFNFSVNYQRPFTDNKRHIYIADFYIPRYGLVIELDGGYHRKPEQREYDRRRDDWFYYHGFQVWRMTNKEADAITPEEISIQLSTFKVIGGDVVEDRKIVRRRGKVDFTSIKKNQTGRQKKKYRVHYNKPINY